jgi:hypothetical protein
MKKRKEAVGKTHIYERLMGQESVGASQEAVSLFTRTDIIQHSRVVLPSLPLSIPL